MPSANATKVSDENLRNIREICRWEPPGHRLGGLKCKEHEIWFKNRGNKGIKSRKKATLYYLNLLKYLEITSARYTSEF